MKTGCMKTVSLLMNNWDKSLDKWSTVVSVFRTRAAAEHAAAIFNELNCNKDNNYSVVERVVED